MHFKRSNPQNQIVPDTKLPRMSSWWCWWCSILPREDLPDLCYLQPYPWHFIIAKLEEQFLCAGHISTSLLRWYTAASPITQMGCQIAQNLCAITTPCTPFWSAHRCWWIILGPPCLPFVTSFHNNPALSQCLHVTVLCHSKENDTAFQTLLQTEQQSQILQIPSLICNGFRIYIYIKKKKGSTVFEKNEQFTFTLTLW